MAGRGLGCLRWVGSLSCQLRPGKFWPCQPSRETPTTSSRPPTLLSVLLWLEHLVKEPTLVFYPVKPFCCPAECWGVAGLSAGVWRGWEWEATEPRQQHSPTTNLLPIPLCHNLRHNLRSCHWHNSTKLASTYKRRRQRPVLSHENLVEASSWKWIIKSAQCNNYWAWNLISFPTPFTYMHATNKNISFFSRQCPPFRYVTII